MVHISTSLAVSLLLVAPAIAVPVNLSKGQNLQTRSDIEARDPSFGSFFRKIRKVVNPSNLKKAASVASLVIRDDTLEAVERSFQDYEELAARDPSFGSFFRKVKKFANPVAKIASFVVREDDPELSARDIEYFEDLAARDPSFGSFFKKIKNFFSPQHIDKAASTAKEASKLAGMLRRSDAEDVSERGFDEEDVEAFTAREMEDLEELAARDPSFGSFFKKVKKFANFKNIKKVASVASLVVREDDEVFERDFADMMELDQLD